jgi:hypothetical protein
MKKISLILLLLAIFTAPFFIQFRRGCKYSIAQNLKIISSDERKNLDLFFRTAFAFDGLGYTLFGDKPMTAVCYYNPKKKCDDIYDFLNSAFDSFSTENLRMCRGWEILQKHRHLFSLEDYALVQCKNFIDNDCTAVLFINKKAVLAAVSNHLADFREILGDEITSEILLARILASNDVFGDVLRNHQGLIGTLLGYGRNNAWLFQRREEIEPLILKKHFSLKKPKGKASTDEIDDLNRRLQRFDHRGILDFNPLLLSLPGFSADPNSEETKQLKIKYEEQYRAIISRYRQTDFLETTFDQMASCGQ